MPRRIEIELTSARDDGTWTWRAAGARQPRGLLDEKILYEGAQVGDVVRAEAEFEVEGIFVVSVTPPKVVRPEKLERIELIGPSREVPQVTTSLVPKSDRPRPEPGDRPRRDDKGDRVGRAGRAGRPSGPGGAGADRGRREVARDRPERQRTPPGSAPRPTRRTEQRGRPATVSPPDDKPRPKRLNPANVHRAAVLEAVPPEQRPIAEAVLRGGIPAVRRAVEEQNTAARAEGRPEIHAEPLVAMAEDLLPRLKAAEWRDRAEAAQADVDEIPLRDLRSVVAASDAGARDDETRLLAGNLRDALERRVNEQREAWITEITTALDEGRVVRALRASARPPDPSMRFPAELALRLSESSSAALAADTPADRWIAVLEAVAASPVRRTVKPSGLPSDAGETLLRTAQQTAGRVPALAPLLGISMPPPPGPPRPPRPRPGPRPPSRRPAGAPAQHDQKVPPIPADQSIENAERDSDGRTAEPVAPDPGRGEEDRRGDAPGDRGTGAADDGAGSGGPALHEH